MQEEYERCQGSVSRLHAERDKAVSDVEKVREELERCQSTLGKVQLSQEKTQQGLDKAQNEVDRLQERLDKATVEARKVLPYFTIIVTANLLSYLAQVKCSHGSRGQCLVVSASH